MCKKNYKELNKKYNSENSFQYKTLKDENSSTKKKIIIFDFDLTLEDRIEIGKATLEEMFKEIA